MDASEQATFLANAISEGINYLAYIRSLQAEPPIASAETLSQFRKALDDSLASEKITREGKVAGYVIVTSMHLSDELIRSIEDVRAHLSTIEPGVRLPASLFHLVDLAWAELERILGPIPVSPSSGEPPRMSIEEWAAMPEDEPGELVDGRLVEEEIGDYEHETVGSFANAGLP